MKRKAVYIGASGHCSARGSELSTVADALLRGDTCHSTKSLLGSHWPYFALPEMEGDGAAVASVGLQLRESLPISEKQWREMPLFIGSSSFFIGMLEKSGAGTGLDLPPAAAFARQIAAWMGIDSTPWCFSTACTSSFAALDAAASLITSGAIPHAVVLGVELDNATTLAGFASLNLLSTERCRPFDRQRDGMVLGEAVAGLFISGQQSSTSGASWRLAGLDLRLDAHSITGPQPDGAIIVEAMHSAMTQAGLSCHEIDLIKVQASGSAGADLAEAVAISQIFGTRVPPLVSLKPYFGHTLGASGTTELTALMACLERNQLPATPGFSEIDPEIGLSPSL
ncbi:MAG: beta-ketoacyl synthase N-terminal-like domain-containing protein, partial [Betaproteobacteria bacterium]